VRQVTSPIDRGPEATAITSAPVASHGTRQAREGLALNARASLASLHTPDDSRSRPKRHQPSRRSRSASTIRAHLPTAGECGRCGCDLPACKCDRLGSENAGWTSWHSRLERSRIQGERDSATRVSHHEVSPRPQKGRVFAFIEHVYPRERIGAQRPAARASAYKCDEHEIGEGHDDGDDVPHVQGAHTASLPERGAR
jgi:hypothetical protein